VTAAKQTTDGTDYTTSYTYKLNGALDEETYPSGRVVKNVLDASGDLAMVKGKKNANVGFFNYAKSFTYNAAGAVTSLQLGNGHWESTTFNSRLQPTQIALGSTISATDLLKLDYGYGTTDNNGNVQTQTITVPTVGLNAGFAAVQTYTYDSLNRLKDATEDVTPTGGSSTASWKQTFLYDRYGNRNFDTSVTGRTTTLGSCATAVCNPSINAANKNQMDSGQGYSYDASGNTVRDASDRKFTYDGENKQTKVESLTAGTNTVAGTLGEYSYDGDGKRVSKTGLDPMGNAEFTIFVYDAAGKEVAEYSTVVSDTAHAQVNYLTSDHLGSPRINTDAKGAIISRHDYHPFGEEIDGTGGRTAGLNYGDDYVRKQFTGYERDGETGLNYAHARNYESTQARMMSVDPYSIVLEIRVKKDEREAKVMLEKYLFKPQRWNRYSYVVNNPLIYVDPSGEIFKLTGSEEDNKRVFNLLKEMLGKRAAENLTYSKDGAGNWVIGYKAGGLAVSGTLGVALEDIVDSSKSVSLSISHTDKLIDFGGAVTTETSDNKDIVVTISADVVATAESAFKMDNVTGTDGKVLTATMSTSIAHELGHSWGLIKDRTQERIAELHIWQSSKDIIRENNDRAVQLENVERQRLGLGLRWQH